MNGLKNHLLATTVFAGVVIAAPGFAQAQDSGQTQPQQQQQQQQQAAPPPTSAHEVSEVVVTGSRIHKNEYNSPDPIQVISGETASLEGLVDTTAVLQQSSLAAGNIQIGNQFTNVVTGNGPGTNTISLRGLGANRTLVLIDGRRAGPSGVGGTVGSVDLSTIPQSEVDRVEILKSGASSIYGSDAIAGVINVITKRNLDGGVIHVSGDASFKGGGNQYEVDGAWGKVFDKGYFNLGFSYFDQEPLLAKDRSYTSCAMDMVFDPVTGKRADYTQPDGKGFHCFNLLNDAFAVTGFGGVFQYPTPGFVPPADGVSPLFPGLVRAGRAGHPDTFAYRNDESPFYGDQTVISPLKRFTLTANGGFDLSADTQAYGSLLYNRRESSQTGARQLFPLVAAGNPNNPFGNAVGASAQPIIAIPYTFRQDVDYFRGVGGVKGRFNEGFLGGWDWDLYFQGSHSHAAYYKDEIYNDRISALTEAGTQCDNNPFTGNLAFPGNISHFSCSALPNGIPWEDPRVLAGDFTSAERKFLFTTGRSTTTYDEAQVEGTITGDLMTLPAGKVSAAFGATWRYDSIDDEPDELSRTYNIWGLTSAGPTKGNDDVKEVFGEIEAPLIKGVPLIQSLDLSASARYTSYRVGGSDTTWKLGLNWQINPDLRLRGTAGTSFRAAELYELFLNRQSAFQGQGNVDPCINWQNSTNANIQKNCALAGVPAGYTGAGPSATIFISGSPNLKPETSTAYSWGFVFTPRFFPGFNVAVDYSDIRVENEIAAFGPGQILGQCYGSNQTFPTSPFCNLFTRDNNPASPTFLNILTVNSSYTNIALQHTRAIDLSAQYNHDFGVGRLSANLQFTWVLSQQLQVAPGAFTENYVGTTFSFGFPSAGGPGAAGLFQVRWDSGPWTFAWTGNIIGEGSDFGQNIYGTMVLPNSRYAGQTDAVGDVRWKGKDEMTMYHSLSVRRTFNDGGLVFEAGVQNVFDEHPPTVSPPFEAAVFGTTQLGPYDYIGRRVFIDITKRF